MATDIILFLMPIGLLGAGALWQRLTRRALPRVRIDPILPSLWADLMTPWVRERLEAAGLGHDTRLMRAIAVEIAPLVSEDRYVEAETLIRLRLAEACVRSGASYGGA